MTDLFQSVSVLHAPLNLRLTADHFPDFVYMSSYIFYFIYSIFDSYIFVFRHIYPGVVAYHTPETLQRGYNIS